MQVHPYTKTSEIYTNVSSEADKLPHYECLQFYSDLSSYTVYDLVDELNLLYETQIQLQNAAGICIGKLNRNLLDLMQSYEEEPEHKGFFDKMQEDHMLKGIRNIWIGLSTQEFGEWESNFKDRVTVQVYGPAAFKKSFKLSEGDNIAEFMNCVKELYSPPVARCASPYLKAFNDAVRAPLTGYQASVDAYRRLLNHERELLIELILSPPKWNVRAPRTRSLKVLRGIVSDNLVLSKKQIKSYLPK
ncbi:hypothetical protein J4H29_11615 [Vibrio alginolyticus]|uniref:hypothetical protein n=1 Tax=Vibrio alginolyticus TaxID=663 RepID=UPI001BD5C7CE|nr:hypothetical protein [Vibrio alginolyticus]MBT0025385.1 hypothetical protein [Vibrio alginolyticus]